MNRRIAILALLPFLLVGVGLVVGGYLTDPSALTDDGLSTRTFLYIMGGGFVFVSLAIMKCRARAAARPSKRLRTDRWRCSRRVNCALAQGFTHCTTATRRATAGLYTRHVTS